MLVGRAGGRKLSNVITEVGASALRIKLFSSEERLEYFWIVHKTSGSEKI